MLWFWMAGLSGCGLFPDRGDKPVIPPEQKYLESADQVLPAAIVGVPYAASVSVSGGDPPYTWTVVEKGGLPAGLDLTPEGQVEGIPTEAGDFQFALMAEDSVGRQKRSLVSLQIVLQPDTVACGETISGSFVGNALEAEGPDLSDLENIAWLAVDVPDDLTTRIELVFTNSAVSTLYIERPEEAIGSWNIEDHYVGYFVNTGAMTIPLDAGTTPTLTGYASQAVVPMVLVGQSQGSWELEVVCSDGPIFRQLSQYPTELGQPLEYDYEVYGDNTDVRIWTEDPLPDWMIWDENTGTVTGTAEEEGAWEFTVIAETADGRRREERTILGVYAVNEVLCGDVIPFDVEEGYFDGDFYAYFDPKGFRVFRLGLVEANVSNVALTLTSSDGYYLGLAGPDPDWLKFYGGAERLYLTDPEVTMSVTTSSYPGVRHFLDATEMFFSAGTIALDTSLVLTVDCDTGPRPDLAALPVIQPLAVVSHTLDVVGGEGPYTWSASDLPAGIVLSAAGVLSGQTGALGAYRVPVTVTDKLGVDFTDTYDLWVGNDSACAGYTSILCGDSVDGTFETTYFNDGNGPDSTTVFCIVDDSDDNLGYEVYSDDGELRVDVADPGATADEMFDLNLGTYVSYVARDASEGVPVDPFSWPDIDDYANLPVLVAIRAFEPGDWTVHLTCE